MKIDIIAEDIIIRKLKQKGANLLLISEEVGEIYIGDEEKARKSKERLIVDPVDGSNNSVRGIPFCSVSIAHAIGDSLEDIKQAVILDLGTRDLYWAEKNKGAFFNDQLISVSNKEFSEECIFEIDFDFYSLIRELKKYESIIKQIYRPRTMGSNALSFGLLAKGCIDGFFDFRKSNRLMDIAAGYLIITEAGGKMFSKKGKEFDIKLSLDAELPLVASNAILEPYLKEELRKINKKSRK